MNLSTLKPADGATKKRKRIGRGQGSGHGGTSTRGHKGAQSNSGYSRKFGFEGGQMPLQRRLPKVGFKNPFRVEYIGVNLDTLQLLAEKHSISEFNLDTFKKYHLASKNDKVKILGRGKISTKINVACHAFTEAAKTAIESVGGTANITK
jgi:large subunit ribosomal protein L15